MTDARVAVLQEALRAVCAERDAAARREALAREALEAIEGMAGAAGAGEIPAMPIARRARRALAEADAPAE